MIHIIADYFVQPDETCYIVGKKKRAVRKNPDTGIQEETEIFKAIHYLGSMHSAVRDVQELYRKDKLSEMDMSLDEAVQVLQTADRDLKSVLYRALGEEKK